MAPLTNKKNPISWISTLSWAPQSSANISQTTLHWQNRKKKQIEHFPFSLFKLKYTFAKDDPSTRKTRSCKSKYINSSWPQSFSASLTSFNLEKFSGSLAVSLAIGQKLNSKALTLCLLTCLR